MKKRLSSGHWLLSKPIAHRGLWGNGIIENSLTAYDNAAKNGYPIEIDLYMTKDNRLVCFHDVTLDRMTGEKGYIFDKTLDELNALSLNGTNEKIPTFEQVLSLCENKTPLLIELKDQPNKNLIPAVIERLKKYKGEFAIQSFNPLYINKVKKHAPEFIRGILATECHAKEKNFFIRYLLKHMNLNFLIKPDFISYSFTGLPLPKRKIRNKKIICWTIENQTDYNKIKPYAQNIIFENFIPE
jgi:glycerophosphoryl diester phosphodiesterase